MQERYKGTPVRIGRAPKRAMMFRCEVPFDKITINLVAPDGSAGQKLEFLANGQQVVVDGIHPDTGKRYRWSRLEPGEFKLQQLHCITEAEAQQLIEDAERLLIDQFGYTRPQKSKSASGGEDWGPLLENIRDGNGLHDSTRDLAAKLVRAGTHPGAVVNLLRAEMNNSNADHDARWQERYDDIPRAVSTAENKIKEEETEVTGDLLQTSGDFVDGFKPPDYLIDGLLQKGFLYAMTGKTGDGKTAVALRIAAQVALGLPIGALEVEKGRVLFFAGENPDDIRSRWVKQCEELQQDPAAMDVVFLPGALPISNAKIRKKIDAEAAKHGAFALLIIDTSAAYFPGDDENSNKQLGDHARMLRGFVNLPGRPTVVVTCHPTKNPDMDNLLPRGGGAFTAEIDGNLVCIKDHDAMVAEISTHGKFRGPEFAPFSFQLTRGTSELLKDTKGRSVWTVTATPITNAEQDKLSNEAIAAQDSLLRVMLKMEPAALSLSQLADKLLWLTHNGEPNKSRVQRVMYVLVAAKLAQKRRNGRYSLTAKGHDEAAGFADVAGPKKRTSTR